MTMKTMMGKREWRTTLMNELSQGKELARQLRAQLDSPSSPEAQRFLMEEILGCYSKALCLLNCRDDVTAASGEAETTFSFAVSESPRTPQGRDADWYPPHVSKKRKTSSPQWTEEVRVVSGLEGPPEDGYNWRKYGQKDILGSNFPRGYYRCTHRHAQGCLATKQVQRSDSDLPVFEVTYRGRHTCVQSSHSPSRTKDASGQEQGNRSTTTMSPTSQSQSQPQQRVPNIGTSSDLTVKTEEAFPCFSFINPIESDRTGETSDIFGLLDGITAPGTPEPGLFPTSMCQLSRLTSCSDANENISAPGSVTNSPISWDAIFPPLDTAIHFDPDFHFDDLEFLL